ISFQDARIFLNDFVLPSHPIIHGKTFLRCEIIGPSNCVFAANVQNIHQRLPVVDAVWMNNTKYNPALSNVIVFMDCTFRECSFQRITLYIDMSNYDESAVPYGGGMLNFLSVSPTKEQVEERRKLLEK